MVQIVPLTGQQYKAFLEVGRWDVLSRISMRLGRHGTPSIVGHQAAQAATMVTTHFWLRLVIDCSWYFVPYQGRD